MNKQALVELVHGKIGGTKVQAEEVVESLISEITKTLKKGDEVSIAGLGIFSVKTRAASFATPIATLRCLTSVVATAKRNRTVAYSSSFVPTSS